MRTLFSVVAVVAVACVHAEALACSCRPLASAAEHAAVADTIFRGRVLQSTPDPAAPEIFAITTFEITAPMKMLSHWDPRSSTMQVRHAATRDGPQCAIWYETGQEVLVVAHVGGDGYLHTSSCDAPRWPENDYRAALYLLPAP